MFKRTRRSAAEVPAPRHTDEASAVGEAERSVPHVADAAVLAGGQHVGLVGEVISAFERGDPGVLAALLRKSEPDAALHEQLLLVALEAAGRGPESAAVLDAALEELIKSR